MIGVVLGPSCPKSFATELQSAAAAASLNVKRHNDSILLVSSPPPSGRVDAARPLRCSAQHALQHTWTALDALGDDDGADPANALLHNARARGWVDDVVPLHDPPSRPSVRQLLLDPPPTQLAAYVGPEGGLYFAFVRSLALWLLIPAAAGALVDWWTAAHVDTPAHAVYGLMLVLWAHLGMRFWWRLQHRLAQQWKLEALGHREPAPRLRHEFRGTLRPSPVTGRPELHFGYWQRLPRLALSLAVTVAFLAFAVAAMVACLNMDGLFDGQSPLYVRALNARFPSRPGMTSPEDWLVVQYLPTLFHSMLILSLNTAYASICARLTKYENWRTHADHEYAFIAKRIAFEAFDCYLSLFWIAFWRRDLVQLRHELIGLFVADALRRLSMETVLPWLYGMLSMRRQRSLDADSIEHQCHHLPEHDWYDDWVEVVISLGYVLLFGAAMPLCAALAVVTYAVEVRQDALKVVRVTRRPLARQARTIGVWFSVLQKLVLASIITNAALLCYASNQVELFIGHDSSSAFGGHNATSLAAFLLLEHAMVFLCWCIDKVVPEMDHDTKIARLREKHLKRQQENRKEKTQ